METRRARTYLLDFKLSDIRERTDAELLELISGRMSRLISIDLDDEFVEVGLSVRQSGHRVVGAFTAVGHYYTIEPIALVDDARGDSIVIRGRSVDDELGDPRMSITKGISGIQDCTLEPSVRAPAFEFVCPLNSYDGVFQFYLKLRGVKGEEQGTYFSTWDSQLWGKAAPPEGWVVRDERHVGRSEFEALLLANINELRRNKGLRPLELVRQQKKRANELYERYAVMSRASDAGVRERAERIKRAICMGYWVGEDIQDYAWFSDDDIGLDPDAYIERQLATPLFRRELLDPAMTHVSILMYPRGRRADVAVVAYARSRERPHSWRVNQVLEGLNKARSEYGLEPVRWYKDLNATSESLDEKMSKGKMEEEDAFSGWYLSSAREYNYAVETNFYFDYDLREISGFGDLLRLKGSPSAGSTRACVSSTAR